MKIGILTLPLHVNYGGIMQAWALQTVLSRMGHDVKVIDFDREYKVGFSDFLCKFPKRIFAKYVQHKNVPIFQEKLQREHFKLVTQNTSHFVKEHLQRRIVSKLSEIEKNEFDAIIIGSDQIWRYIYFSGAYSTNDVFGAFAQKLGMKCLSYAASFGTDNLDEYPQKETDKIKKLLSKFSGVSVREDSAVDLCKTQFGVDAVHVLDPTMLIPKEDYVKLIAPAQFEQFGVMEYILDIDQHKIDVLDAISKEYAFKVFSCKAADNGIAHSVEKWLSGFNNSSFVVTDSFHACVFSIIFNKPFIVIANPDRGVSRILSLLKMFHLEHHLVTDINQIDSIEDYQLDNGVFETLKLWQDNSMFFLTDSLAK